MEVTKQWAVHLGEEEETTELHTDDVDPNGGEGGGGGTTALIVIGVLVALIALGFLIYCFCCKGDSKGGSKSAGKGKSGKSKKGKSSKKSVTTYSQFITLKTPK
ncbi:hypothetical protein TYRP_007510 [Tyrophagus putrescentiae]|nr:hypothetical protein TYRP_007510 [Tyrophagus putrescentiae]